MEKLDGKSMDIVAQNIARLKELFPEVFSEGKINFDQLQELLGNYVVEDEDHYNFTWHGKRATGRLAQTPSTGTLRPCEEESVDWDTTQNLFIEGDNLEVLKLLQKSYHRKVKMIYIDPPYNTGNDFVYKDNRKDGVKNYLEMTGQLDGNGKKVSTNYSADGRFHTNWLNMMYPRLKLARNLLRDDGVIFISIDDNEIHNLRKICDEIFGQQNFIGQVTVQGNPRGRDYGGIARMHDYLLVYQKSDSAEIYDLTDHDKEFPFADKISGFEIRELRNRNIAFHQGNRPNLYYPFYLNANNVDENGFCEISLEPKPGFIEVLPIESQGYKTVWRWGKSKAAQNLNIDIVGKSMQNGGYQIVEKYRKKSRMARSIWNDKDVNTERGTLLVKSLFDKKIYDFPKPVEMLMRIVEMSSREDDIILDFFSGSSTTAHAVMQSNAEDGGNRRFIMVQIPEKCDPKSEAVQAGYATIAEIGKERIRRAAKKIKKDNPDYKGDLGFKIFKLDSSNLKRWEAGFDTLEQDLIDAVDYIKKDRSDEDILYEILLKYGLDLTVPIETRAITNKTVYSINMGALVVCLDKDISMDVVNGIGALKEQLKPENMRVVFKDDGFEDDVAKTNTLQTLKRYGIKDVKSL